MSRSNHDTVWINVPLDAETHRMLARLADVCHSPSIESVAASLLHDIIRDDQEAHGDASPASAPMTWN
jgi:hypothetical protein